MPKLKKIIWNTILKIVKMQKENILIKSTRLFDIL